MRVSVEHVMVSWMTSLPSRVAWSCGHDHRGWRSPGARSTGSGWHEHGLARRLPGALRPDSRTRLLYGWSLGAPVGTAVRPELRPARARGEPRYGRRAARAGACGGKPGARGRKRGGGERRGARADAPSRSCAREGERGRAGRAVHGSREGGGRVRGVGGEREREKERKKRKEKENGKRKRKRKEGEREGKKGRGREGSAPGSRR